MRDKGLINRLEEAECPFNRTGAGRRLQSSWMDNNQQSKTFNGWLIERRKSVAHVRLLPRQARQGRSAAIFQPWRAGDILNFFHSRFVRRTN